MGVPWTYYGDGYFEIINKKYLPISGEGETKATQIVTAVNKLVYKWYNDGDVYDNAYYMSGWANDLSDYANWLYQHTTEKVQEILDGITSCHTNDEYEDILKNLTIELFNEEYLAEQNKIEKVNTIYDCYGKFQFVEDDEENEGYY